MYGGREGKQVEIDRREILEHMLGGISLGARKNR